jgi:16S rRNA (adenine1518-N6/adenine1519-N6)-dimethyltransferase
VARQKLGQHFLIRGSILERIAAAACPAREALVVEIGPGRGALTEKLLKRADRVIAVELDGYLVERLQRRFTDESRVQIVQGDALATDLAQWGPAVIAGNLPYSVVSPILEKVAAVRASVRRAVFLIQKEVAQRLVAQPGQRAYGFLTVATALFFQAEMLFEVKPSSFHPPPEVDSAVVRLTPRESAQAGNLADSAGFLRFVGQCFRQKRKTIRNNLAAVYGQALVDTWPEARLRAEQISLEQFAEIYGRL